MKSRKKRIITISGSYPDIGKGIFTASLGYLLQTYGVQLSILKFDGYMNYSSGTMNPYNSTVYQKYTEEEVFVLEDGYEADADSGYYERFLGRSFDERSNMTNGKVFREVFDSETKSGSVAGEILSYRSIRTHISQWISKAAQGQDVLLLEVGGTIGDKESEIIYEVLQKLTKAKDIEIFNIMLSPYIGLRNEQLELSSRTKLTRQAFEQVRKLGLLVDIIVFRTAKDGKVGRNDLGYVAYETGLTQGDFFIEPDCDDIYRIPDIIDTQKITQRINKSLTIKLKKKLNDHLKRYVIKKELSRKNKKVITLGIFGKTVSYDSYVSLKEAVEHSCVALGTKYNIVWLDDHFVNERLIKTIDGFIVAEGRDKHTEKRKVIRYAYENKKPLLCISLGMDLLLEELVEGKSLKSDSRIILNSELRTGSIKFKVKGSQIISRGTYSGRIRTKTATSKLKAFNVGVLSTGISLDGNETILCEVKTHPFLCGVRFHPEYESYPNKPHIIFTRFIEKTNVRKTL